jgi:hypothetical protein
MTRDVIFREFKHEPTQTLSEEATSRPSLLSSRSSKLLVFSASPPRKQLFHATLVDPIDLVYVELSAVVAIVVSGESLQEVLLIGSLRATSGLVFMSVGEQTLLVIVDSVTSLTWDLAGTRAASLIAGGLFGSERRSRHSMDPVVTEWANIGER